jgi:hypothetical protein
MESNSFHAVSFTDEKSALYAVLSIPSVHDGGSLAGKLSCSVASIADSLDGSPADSLDCC